MAADRLQLDDFLPFRLSVASNAVSRTIARAYESLFGLRIPEWRLIAVLAEQPGLTQQQLVARTEMDKMTISRAAQELVDRRLAERRPNPDDKRSHCLALTEDGHRLYAQIAPEALRMEAVLLQELSREEVVALKSMLLRLQGIADRMA